MPKKILPQKNLPKKILGFTLVELSIVMAIVILLALIAIPSYNTYVTGGRRADGTTSLLNLAQQMERYFTENNTYVGATLANVGVSPTSPQSYYNLQILTATATAYTLQAVPQGSQATNDTLCSTLTLNQLGQKGESGTGTSADCW